MKIDSFIWNKLQFKAIDKGDWCYLLNLFLKTDLSSDSDILYSKVNILYINNDADLTNSCFFENLYNQFHHCEIPSPIFFVCNNNILTDSEAIYDKRYLFIDSSIWFRFFISTDSNIVNKIRTHLINNKTKFIIKNAIENFELNLRLVRESYLIKGEHSTNIAPFVFHSETWMKNHTNISPLLSSFFCYNDDIKNVPGLVLRILLIDDKINNGNECKANIIKEILELKLEKNEGVFDFKSHFQNQVCWLTPIQEEINNQSIEILYLDDTNEKINFKESITSKIKCLDKKKIQLIAVKNLLFARKLLTLDSIRFDLIMMDYLLAKNPENPNIREYVTEFWGDGIEKYFEFSEKAKENDPNDNKLSEIYDNIKANRGPMQRLWIFPITAFNQTFIDDLRNKGIRLIDYYWYLSRGADPINTPYLFIYTLNMFLMLMLEQAIFEFKDLKGFLLKSRQRFNEIYGENSKTPENENKTDEFPKKVRLKNFFASEYIFFINQFSVEEQIARDKEAGSLFAEYVYKNFINNPEYEDLFKISSSIRRLYHCLAFGEDKDYLKAIERLFRMIDLIKLSDKFKKLLKEVEGEKNHNIIDQLVNDFLKAIKYRFYG